MSAFVTPLPSTLRSIQRQPPLIHQHNCHLSPSRRLNISTSTTIPLQPRQGLLQTCCSRPPPSASPNDNDQENETIDTTSTSEFLNNLRNGPPPTAEYIESLLKSDRKGDQQRGLLLVRKLPPLTILELLLLSLRTSNNDFIRATAAVALGEIDLSEAPIESRNTVLSTLSDLLATDEDYAVRSAAAAGMGYATTASNTDKKTGTAMIEALSRALLEDSDWQVQFSCLASLGVLGKGNKKVVRILLGWLNKENDLLVQAAVGALGDIGDVEALPGLLGVLGADDMMTRQRLAQALGNINDCTTEPAAIDALRTLSKDRSFIVREAANAGLSGFGVGDRLQQSEGNKDGMQQNAENGKNSMDDKVGETDELEGLVQSLKDGLEGLGMETLDISEDKISDDDLVDREINNILQGDEAGNAEESASDALRRRLERSFSTEWPAGQHPSLSSDTPGSYRHPSNTTSGDDANSVSASLSSSDVVEKKGSSESEAPSTDKEALQKLVEKIKSGEEKQRLPAAIELRKFDVSLAREAVIEANGMHIFKTPHKVRSVCAGILGRAGDVKLLAESLREDPEENVRSACCDALTDAVNINKEMKEEAINVCIERLNDDKHWLVRISSAIALGSIGKGNAEVESALIGCVKNAPNLKLEKIHLAVVRRHAVTALGFLGAVNAVSVFEEILQEPKDGVADIERKSGLVDQTIRYRIAAALSGIECQESVALAQKLVGDRDQFVSEMAQSSLDSLAKRGFI